MLCCVGNADALKVILQRRAVCRLSTAISSSANNNTARFIVSIRILKTLALRFSTLLSGAEDVRCLRHVECMRPMHDA